MLICLRILECILQRWQPLNYHPHNLGDPFLQHDTSHTGNLLNRVAQMSDSSRAHESEDDGEDLSNSGQKLPPLSLFRILDVPIAPSWISRVPHKSKLRISRRAVSWGRFDESGRRRHSRIGSRDPTIPLYVPAGTIAHRPHRLLELLLDIGCVGYLCFTLHLDLAHQPPQERPHEVKRVIDLDLGRHDDGTMPRHGAGPKDDEKIRKPSMAVPRYACAPPR